MTPYYQDAAVTLYHGDCLVLMQDFVSVDHVITDPPYTEHTHKKQWVASALTKGRARFSGPGLKTELGFAHMDAQTQQTFSRLAVQILRRWVLVFADMEGAESWRVELTDAGMEYARTCVWVKPDAAPQFTGDRPGSGAELIVCAHPKGRKRWNGGGQHGVFHHCVNNFGRTEREHPTAKPVTLMTELVTLFTDEGDTILDPFAGSGTTAVAAKLNGRKCILIEREEKYCEVAAKRLAQTEPGQLFAREPRAKPQSLLDEPVMAGAVDPQTGITPVGPRARKRTA